MTEERYDANTLFKVRDALRRAGLDDDAILAAINELHNAGILFRERGEDEDA